MDLSTAVLLAWVSLIWLNQMVLRLPRLTRVAPVVWGVMAVDVVAGIAAFALGMPGFEHLPAVSAIIALMLVLHAAQLYNTRVRLEAADRAARGEAIRAEYEALKRSAHAEE